MTRSTLAILAFGLGGCGAILPRIPVASEQRRVVSLDGRGGVVCGAFDTGEAFCGGHLLELPYEELNQRGTGRALSASSTDGTTCVHFESGDVGCATVGVGWSFVERPSGVAFHSIVVGQGWGCGVDTERYVDCWGPVLQHRGDSLLEAWFNADGGRPSRRDGRSASSRGTFRMHGFADVRQLRGSFSQLCAVAGDEVLCAGLSSPSNRSRGFEGGFSDSDFGAGNFDESDFGRDGFGEGDLGPGTFGAGRFPSDPWDCDDQETGFPTPTRRLGRCDERDREPWGAWESSTWILDEPRVVEIARARSIASLGSLACAGDADGRVTCWGDWAAPLSLRSMRAESARSDARPMEVPELAGASSIELTADHACALSTSSGPRAHPNSIVAETNKGPEESDQLWCWGENELGQLGNAVNALSSLPVRVQGLEDVDAFAVSPGASCATSAGELWCWGRLGSLPELEDPADDPCLNPKAVCVPHRVKGWKTLNSR